MTARQITVALAFAATFFLPGTLPVAEADEVEKAQPRELSANDFQELLERSPFTRSLNLPRNLVLTGVAVVDGRPIATFIDVEAGQPMVLSGTANELGWKLVEVQKMDDLQTAVAIIAVESGETIRAYHDEERMKNAMKRLRYAGGPRAPQLSANLLPDWINDLDPVTKGIAIQTLIEKGEFDAAPFQAVDMALAVPEPQARGPAVSAAFGKLGGGVGGIEITDAVNRLNAMPHGRDRDFAINGLAHGLVGRDPEGALKWANSISQEGFRKVVVQNVSRRIEARSRSGRK